MALNAITKASNNRLKLAARGRSTGAWRRHSRAAA